MPIRARLLALRLSLPALSSGVPLACGPGTTPDAMDDGSSGGAGESTGAPAPATTMPGTTTTASTSTSDDTGTTTATPSADSSGGSSDEAGFIPTPDMGGGDGLPLGEQCESDRDCQSMSCFQIGEFGIGFCSECAHDSDCMEGDGPGTCSLGPGYAVCTGGEPGAMCESSEGCAGDQVCAPVLDGSPFQFCSECATDAECDEGSACTPGFTEGNYCALPGSIPNDEPCPEAGSDFCMSTHCTEAPYDGMPIGLYLCGECTSDTDCAEGQTCTPAFISDMEFSGSVCT